jgi:hypothetical protein
VENFIPEGKRLMAENSENAAGSSNSGDASEGFLEFFKKYINGWVAIALILPTAVTWKGVPVYEAQRGLLVTFTGLTCGLVLAFLFSNRSIIRGVAKTKSQLGIVGSFLIPLLLIVATGYCGYKYVEVLKFAAQYYDGSFTDALKNLEMNQIRDGNQIMAFHIGIMLFAECALFFMALREWKPNKDGSK